MSQTRGKAVASNAKVPQDHALRAEAAGAPVTVTVPPEATGGGEIEVTLPRDLVDSYEAINVVMTGYTMPVMQQLDVKVREAILAAAKDDGGKVRASVVSRILVSAMTLAAQGE